MGVEDLFQQLRDRLGRAVCDGDLPRQEPALDEPADLLRNQLQLGSFPAALQQPQGLPRGHRRDDVGLEDVALQMVQRRAGAGRIMLGPGRPTKMLSSEPGSRRWKVSPRLANAVRPGS